ncbi:12715_t:CDS:2 [Ambispora gerdemannii]|uniref:12715_t:CDS:1 n=1 Tax=Ambispora gerdemannii TaxID=144530 RepID=A0A9N9GQZ1_9GLOM|nr:12715_t:CDS:2 [Ambispora gerdemannii]
MSRNKKRNTNLTKEKTRFIIYDPNNATHSRTKHTLTQSQLIYSNPCSASTSPREPLSLSLPSPSLSLNLFSYSEQQPSIHVLSTIKHIQPTNRNESWILSSHGRTKLFVEIVLNLPAQQLILETI